MTYSSLQGPTLAIQFPLTLCLGVRALEVRLLRPLMLDFSDFPHLRLPICKRNRWSKMVCNGRSLLPLFPH